MFVLQGHVAICCTTTFCISHQFLADADAADPRTTLLGPAVSAVLGPFLCLQKAEVALRSHPVLAAVWSAGLSNTSVLTSQQHQPSGWPSCRNSIPGACLPLPSAQRYEKTQPSGFCPPAPTDVAQQQRQRRWVPPVLIDDTRRD